jgi:hypothetical protein
MNSGSIKAGMRKVNPNTRTIILNCMAGFINESIDPELKINQTPKVGINNG